MMDLELEDLLAHINAGTLVVPDGHSELLELAVKGNEARLNENVSEWASRVASDVASADDYGVELPHPRNVIDSVPADVKVIF